MKKKEEQNEAKEKSRAFSSLIAFACVFVLIVVLVFLIPVFSANKLADAFDREGISYSMINNKKISRIYNKRTDEDGEEHIEMLTPYEDAEEKLRETFDLDGVEFSVQNCGIFYLTNVQDEESEIIVGQFYRFAKGSEQVYAAVAESVQGQTVLNTVAIRKGSYVFILLGSEIPSSMENVLSHLSGAREQTLSE